MPTTRTAIVGEAPLANLVSYSADLRAMTGGRAAFLLRFSRWQIVGTEDEPGDATGVPARPKPPPPALVAAAEATPPARQDPDEPPAARASRPH
jgi:translation elongation factor EF-G